MYSDTVNRFDRALIAFQVNARYAITVDANSDEEAQKKLEELEPKFNTGMLSVAFDVSVDQVDIDGINVRRIVTREEIIEVSFLIFF